ncbi:MAG: ATP-binding cassette domain-containing protein [Microbacteriaceae bacterium]
MSPPAGRVRARDWGWRHAGRKAWAVSGLDLDIQPGERVLLLGASGAGKSTLIHALCGLLGGADEGEQVGTLDVTGTPGLVLQDPDSQVILERVGDDVAFGCENLGLPRAEIWPRVTQSLRSVGLDIPLDTPTGTLSGGQKQRLALAGVLAMRPDLILLDEPTANLDPDGTAQVREAMARVLQESTATLIVIEHRVAVWQDLVTRVIVLGDGGVVADGPPERVLVDEGERLAAMGVWVPGFPPAAPPRHPLATATELLTGRDVAVGRTAAAVVRSGIHVDVLEGRCLAITGPNGTGKSTLGLTLAGLLAPLAGALDASETLSRGIGPTPSRWKSRDLLTRIGTVFQDPEHQFLASTVRRELEIGPQALGLPAAEIDARVTDLLQRLRLLHLAEANPFTLSGGEKRRLSVATVLATSPRVLVLDEPTFGQDSRTWAELVALLGQLLDKGSSVIAITHDAEFVAALADAELSLGGLGQRGGPVPR